MPAHRIYVEPFGGGGSVLLRKPRSYAEVYNDLDGEIVNLFRVARDNGDALIQSLQLTPFAREEFTESYIPTEDSLEQARRTVVRSFMGFGSNAHNRKTGFRNNSNRSGTTPAHDWANYPDALIGICERLRGVVIENKGAEALCVQLDGRDTLMYVDPPYVASTRDAGGDYRFEMDDAAHRGLANTLRCCTGMVMLSGYSCALYDELYSDWLRIDRAALADGASKRLETLWLNPAASALMPARQLFAGAA